MIHKLIWPAAVLACLLLVAEILNLSAMQHFLLLGFLSVYWRGCLPEAEMTEVLQR